MKKKVRCDLVTKQQQCIHVSTTLPICPTLVIPHYVHKVILFVCVSIKHTGFMFS